MLKLVIANKLYSSWSMRPWLVLRAFEIPFDEIIIPLRQPESRARVLEFSPSGKVPALIDGDQTIWESMAIIETLAERFPQHAIWPKDATARAHARSISNEMHGGFQTLRQGCPMNLGARYAAPAMTDPLKANIDRDRDDLARSASSNSAAAGRFFTVRFRRLTQCMRRSSRGLTPIPMPVSAEARRYMDTILAHPERRRLARRGARRALDDCRLRRRSYGH